MVLAASLLLAVSIIGCGLTAIHVNTWSYVLGVCTVICALMPIPAFWHEKKRFALRDAALAFLWFPIFAAALPFPVLIAARFRAPLQDSFFAHADATVGIDISKMALWAHRHYLGSMINHSYALLVPLLVISTFVPALTGRAAATKEFLIANLVAFAIALPLFAAFPAIGPWSYYHFVPSPEQMNCQAALLQLRMPGAAVLGPGAIVSFPSFHVIWAMLCTRTLWSFRFLRILVTILSAVIILSTMTTGWHYFSDVAAGALVAVLAMLMARRLADERM